MSSDSEALKEAFRLLSQMQEGAISADHVAAEIAQMAKAVQEGTAHVHSISYETSKRYVTATPTAENLFNGANPIGKAAEAVVASDLKDFHKGFSDRIINPPKNPAKNFVDVKINPDPIGKQDFVFVFKNSKGRPVYRTWGQVKTGRPYYVADRLIKMSKMPGYGKVAYLDSRFVNADGTPRVAPDGFTATQAEKIKAAKLTLRGFKDLHARAKAFVENYETLKEGQKPKATYQEAEVKEKVKVTYKKAKTKAFNPITNEYKARGVLKRACKGSLIGALTAGGLTAAIQWKKKGFKKVEWKEVGQSAGVGGAVSFAAVGVDAAVFHSSRKIGEALGKNVTAEAAKKIANVGTTGLFSVVSSAMDIHSGYKAVQDGDKEVADAVVETTVSVLLNAAPVVVAAVASGPALPFVAVGIMAAQVVTKSKFADLPSGWVGDLKDKIVYSDWNPKYW
jgi:hypothetical protein